MRYYYHHHHHYYYYYYYYYHHHHHHYHYHYYSPAGAEGDGVVCDDICGASHAVHDLLLCWKYPS